VGGVELGNGLAISVKVSETAHTVADLVSRNACVTDTSLSGMIGASAATIAPYSSGNTTVIVSEVSTDANGKATVTWSKALNGTPRPVTQQITLPTALGTPSPANISLILGEVTYQYTPNLGYTITGTVPIAESYYLFPRVSSAVQYPCS
jgi:Flp pilus assembly protein TadG